jgi:hypothetical protein
LSYYVSRWLILEGVIKIFSTIEHRCLPTLNIVYCKWRVVYTHYLVLGRGIVV